MINIAVVGGHGQVGQSIVHGLVDRGYQVILLGRNVEKMTVFAQKFTPVLFIRQIDITKEISPEQMVDIDMVIVCLDQTNTQFLRTCQALGIDYLDISANSDFLLSADQVPEPRKSRRVIGLGLAPGITNVAAMTYTTHHPEVKSVDIDILLGLGDRHGTAAVEWTFTQLNRTYYHQKFKDTENFVHGKKTYFGKAIGQCRSYNFDFADQHLLNQRDHTRTYTTYLGFDHNAVTGLLAQIKDKGLAGIFKHSMVISILGWLMKKGIFGSQRFAVKISNGQVNDPHQIILVGKEEAKMTAEVVVFATTTLLDGAFPAGAYQLSDLTTLSEILALPRLSRIS